MENLSPTATFKEVLYNMPDPQSFDCVMEKLQANLPKLAGQITMQATLLALSSTDMPRLQPSGKDAPVDPHRPEESVANLQGQRLQAFEKACKLQTNEGGTKGAESLFRADGLPPQYWGISKSQLQEFFSEVKAAQSIGMITNTTPSHRPQYDDERFNDPQVGPNMHQVNKGFIKPITAKFGLLPGASYSVMKNFASCGTLCDLFFSHAWDEGVYEFLRSALASWPAECTGAYFCCLSNPQNLDISSLLGSSLSESPFCKVLASLPSYLIMLSNRNTPIHLRLWCVLEAYEAHRVGIKSVKIAGPATQLITGDRGNEFKKAGLELQQVEKEFQLQMEHGVNSGMAKDGGSELKSLIENHSVKIQKSSEDYARAQVAVLLMPAERLIDLDKAETKMESDAVMIRREIAGKEQELVELVGSLMHDNICCLEDDGVRNSHIVSGPLGELSLLTETLQASSTWNLGRCTALLQMAKWLRAGPEVKTLDLHEAKALGEQGLTILFQALANDKLKRLSNLRLKLCVPFLKDPLTISAAVAAANRQHERPLVQHAIFAALLKAEPQQLALHISSMTQWLKLRDEGVRKSAVELFGALDVARLKQNEAALREVGQDVHVDVRKAAAALLSRISKQPASVSKKSSLQARLEAGNMVKVIAALEEVKNLDRSIAEEYAPLIRNHVLASNPQVSQLACTVLRIHGLAMPAARLSLEDFASGNSDTVKKAIASCDKAHLDAMPYSDLAACLDKLVACLDHREADVQQMVVHQLCELRSAEFELQKIEAALIQWSCRNLQGNTCDWTRCQACRAFALAGKAALPHLAGLLCCIGDARPIVRDAASKALHQLKQQGMETQQINASLAQCGSENLRHKDLEMRRGSCRALGLAGQAALPHLEGLVRCMGDADGGVRDVAHDVLRQLKEQEVETQQINASIALWSSENLQGNICVRTRCWACKALGFAGQAALPHLGLLVRCMGGAEDVRDAASEALHQLKEQAVETQQINASLAQCASGNLRHDDLEMRLGSCRALGLAGQAALPHVGGLMCCMGDAIDDGEDYGEKHAAHEALCQLKQQGVETQQINASLAQWDLENRGHDDWALGRTGSHAFRALGLAGQEAVPHLKCLVWYMGDRDSRVTDEVDKVLCQLKEQGVETQQINAKLAQCGSESLRHAYDLKMLRGSCRALGLAGQAALPNLEGLVHCMGYADGGVRDAAYRAIRQLKEQGVETQQSSDSLAKCGSENVRHLDSGMRCDSCRALGLAGQAALPHLDGLVRCMGDANSNVRDAAHRAISQLKERRVETEQINDSLAQCASENLRHACDLEMRLGSCRALGLAGQAALPHVEGLVRCMGDANGYVRDAAHGLLCKLKKQGVGTEQINASLARWGWENLRHDDWEVRRESCRALGLAGQAALPHVGGLVNCMGDARIDVRDAASEALHQLKEPGVKTQQINAILALRGSENMRHDDLEMRRGSCRALGLAGQEALPHLEGLVRCMGHADGGVRDAAHKALCQLKEQGVETRQINDFLARWGSENLRHDDAIDWRARQGACRALGLAGQAAFPHVAGLVRCMGDGPLPYVRDAASEALRQLKKQGVGTEQINASLEKWGSENLTHADWEIRRASCRALGLAGQAALPHVGGLVHCMGDANGYVRDASHNALCQLKDSFAGSRSENLRHDDGIFCTIEGIFSSFLTQREEQAVETETQQINACLAQWGSENLRHENLEMRLGSCRALGLADQAALPHLGGLVRCMGDASKVERYAAVREAAYRAIRQLKEQGVDTQQSNDSLARWGSENLRHASGRVRRESRRALGLAGQAARPYLEGWYSAGLASCLRDEDSDVRAAACEALCQLKQQGVKTEKSNRALVKHFNPVLSTAFEEDSE